MLDINFLKNNPEVVKENIRKKFQDHKLVLVDEVIALDEQRRATQQQVDDLKANRNKISNQIGQLMGQGKKEEAEKVKAEVANEGAKIEELDAKQKELEEKIARLERQMKRSNTEIITTFINRFAEDKLLTEQQHQTLLSYVREVNKEDEEEEDE